VVFTSLFASTAGIAFAQTNPDTGVRGVCVSNCGTSSSSSSTYEGPGLLGALIHEIFRDRSDERRARGTELNNQAVLLEKAGQLEEALRLYRRALELNPNAAMIKRNIASVLAQIAWRDVKSARETGNLATIDRAEVNLSEGERYNIPGGPDYQSIADGITNIRSAIAETRRRTVEERQLADASRTIAKLSESVAKSLMSENPGLRGAGLDFGDPTPQPTVVTAAAVPTTSALVTSNDPMVVDARNRGALPPGVPRLEEVENSPGKEAWLRGMDAVVQRDWKLALAWFQTAQLRDPTNAALGRAILLAQWAIEGPSVPPTKQGVSQPTRTEPPAPVKPIDPPTAAEMARLEAALDKMMEKQTETVIAELATLEAKRLAELQAVERANLTLANQLGGRAIVEVEHNNLAGAIELLASAELYAPQEPNFRSTREWLQSKQAELKAKQKVSSQPALPKR
jgi:tetratricopeptide (TPR) repeat protein